MRVEMFIDKYSRKGITSVVWDTQTQTVYYDLYVRPHSLVVLVSGHTASGTYRCEVSVEKSFYTLSSQKNVTVVGE